MSSSSRTWCAQGTKQQFMKVSLWRFSTQDILDQDKADRTHNLPLRIPNVREGEDNFRPPCTCVYKLPLLRAQRPATSENARPGTVLTLGCWGALPDCSTGLSTFVLRDQHRESLGYRDHGQDRELTFFTGGLRVASGVQLSASCSPLLCADLLS